MPIQKNNKIKVHYTGTLNDSSVFDTSENGEPLEFIVGSGQMIPGFDKAVLGMELNEEKTVKIPSHEAYGDRDEGLLRDFPVSSLAPDFQPQLGMVIGLSDDQGRTYPAVVANITSETITLDLNHPLSGQELNFSIRIVSIES